MIQYCKDRQKLVYLHTNSNPRGNAHCVNLYFNAPAPLSGDRKIFPVRDDNKVELPAPHPSAEITG